MQTPIKIRYEGDVAIFAVPTDLGMNAGSAFREAVSRLLEEGRKKFVLDLSYMMFLNSSDLGVIVLALKKIRERSGDMVLVTRETKFRHILEMTHLNSVIAAYPTVAEALKSLESTSNTAAASS